MTIFRIGEARGNRLLAAMEADSRARIESHLEPIELKLGAVVCEAGGVCIENLNPDVMMMKSAEYRA